MPSTGGEHGKVRKTRSSKEPTSGRKLVRIAALLFACLGITVWMVRISGGLLIANDAVPSDVAIVEGGDDRSYFAALSALRRHEVQHLIVNLDPPEIQEHLESDANRFVARTAGELAGYIHIVPVESDEDSWMDQMLRDLKPRSVLIFAPEPFSRFERARFRNRLPQYEWSVSAVAYPELFDRHWWRRRAWAKRFLVGAAAWAKWGWRL